MNTITIDSGIYQFVANYAAKRKVSVKSVVETLLTGLCSQVGNDTMDDNKHASKVLSFDELRPELQNILKLSAPMKGTVPEWDLNGDIARSETLNS